MSQRFIWRNIQLFIINGFGPNMFSRFDIQISHASASPQKEISRDYPQNDPCPGHRVLTQIRILMDQGTSSYQSPLWNHRDWGANPDLDYHRHLRVGRHCQKATSSGAESIHNSTDLEYCAFRKEWLF